MVKALPGSLLKQTNTKRWLEFSLLIAVFILLSALSIAIEAVMQQDVTTTSLSLPAVLTLLFLLAHGVIRLRAPYADPIILPTIALLNGIGLLFIRRLDLAELSEQQRINSALVLGNSLKQLSWTAIAVFGFCLILLIIKDHRTLIRYGYTSGLVGLILLALPAVLPKSYSQVNGAKIWVRIPGVFSVQPGEFAKLALAVFFASYLMTKRDVLALASRRILGIDFPRGRDLGPIVVAWSLSLLILVFERDLGSSLMNFGLFIVMLYIATERTSWLIIGLSLFMGGATLAWKLFDHVQRRVDIWLHPFDDPNNAGYQIVQSLFGLGFGGLFGAGPGSGYPNIVPFAESDFIFAAIGEEIGLFGLTAIILLYAFVAVRGMRISLDVRDSFGKLLAGGLAFSLGLQVFVIVGGVSKLIPLTGLTTPFLSYGGSSLVANWCLVAVLLRISDAGRRPITAPAPPVPLRSSPTEVISR